MISDELIWKKKILSCFKIWTSSSAQVSHQTHHHYFLDHRGLSWSEESKCMWTCCKDWRQSLPRVHIYLLSSDRERHLWSPIYFKFLCLCVTFVQRSLHFSGRVFPFFSYFLCYPYFGTFLSTWSELFPKIQVDYYREISSHLYFLTSIIEIVHFLKQELIFFLFSVCFVFKFL